MFKMITDYGVKFLAYGSVDGGSNNNWESTMSFQNGSNTALITVTFLDTAGIYRCVVGAYRSSPCGSEHHYYKMDPCSDEQINEEKRDQ